MIFPEPHGPPSKPPTPKSAIPPTEHFGEVSWPTPLICAMDGTATDDAHLCTIVHRHGTFIEMRHKPIEAHG